MGRKPRSDSPLNQLDEYQRGELRDKLLKSTLSQTKEWLSAELEITTSTSALGNFYQKYCVPYVVERRKFAALKASQIDELARDEEVDWDNALLAQIKQMVFEMSLKEGVDTGELVRLIKVIGDSNKLALDERKVALAEAKAAKYDEAQKVMEDGERSEEEKVQDMKALFGIGN